MKKLEAILQKETKYIQDFVESISNDYKHLNTTCNDLKSMRKIFVDLSNLEENLKSLLFYVIGVRQNIFFLILTHSEKQKSLAFIDAVNFVDKSMSLYESRINELIKKYKNLKR